MSEETERVATDLVHAIIQWLARESALGMRDLQRLERGIRRDFDGRHARISAMPRFVLEERNVLILQAWLADVPIKEIAKTFGLTSRRVRQICAGLAEDRRQRKCIY